MQFMNSNLEKLVKNLSNDDLKYLTQEFGSNILELLKQKDPYPYDCIDSFKRFNEEKLPDRECFDSSVKDGTTGDNNEKLDGHLSDKDYLMCKKTWNEFNMKNIGDYHDHYLKKDVLLLADVFEKFIDTCLKLYRLDSCYYFSSSGSSWDAMLKMTGMRLEKIVNINLYLFIKKGLREGISYIAKRYAKAYNKYMKDYEPNKLSKFITYNDVNNLYGWAMSSYLSYGRFKWLKNVDGFDVNLISEISPIGYILEVDFEYPDKLYVLHNDYPLAPEKLVVRLL